MNEMGRDEINGKLKSGAPTHQLVISDKLISFFFYLVTCTMKLLDETSIKTHRKNSVKLASKQLSLCPILRNKFHNATRHLKSFMVTSKAERIFILSRLVERHLHSRQKIELCRHNFKPPKK